MSTPKFKRYDHNPLSVPQTFIDQQLPACPLCSSQEPHWGMRERMRTSGNGYLFRCEHCGCVLSAPVRDVAGFVHSLRDGGELPAVSLTVEELGSVQEDEGLKDSALQLSALQGMAPVLA